MGKEIQKTGSQLSKSTTLSLIKISKPSDLLLCKLIRDQIKEAGEDVVLTTIRLSVEKCALGLNINMSDSQVQAICIDIMDSYPTDSLEDVRECLKNARQGKYGFGMNSRNSLTMVHVREWMAQHLDRKVLESEKKHKNKKALNSEPIQDIDYEAYKERQKKEGNKEPSNKEQEYKKHYANYIASRQTKKDDTRPNANTTS